MARLVSSSTFAATVLVVGATVAGSLLIFYRNRKEKQKTAPKTVNDDDDEAHDQPVDERIPRHVHVTADNDIYEEEASRKRILSPGTITVAHASVTGTCKKLAQELRDSLSAIGAQNVQLCTVEEVDWWDELLNNEEVTSSSSSAPAAAAPVVVFLLPTHSNGTWPTSATSLQTALLDLKHDWRVEKRPLKAFELRVAAFGMGSSAYDESTMGKPAKEAFREMRSLGAKAIGVVGVGDDAVCNNARKAFESWKDDIVAHIRELVAPSSSCACEDAPSDGGCCQSKIEEPEMEQQDEYFDDEEEEQGREPEVMDLEDMGESMMASNGTTYGEPQEMVTPSQAAALKKEGYKLIGTHSAVKLCRWTKHQLRGRGGCYKHTFYGITSYQCMEATPSLACANKCTYQILKLCEASPCKQVISLLSPTCIV